MAEFDPKAVWPGWETVKVLGRGSFGAVYEIRRDMLGETEKAALKVISIPQSNSEIEQLYDEGYDQASVTSTYREFLKNILGEYSLMRKLNGSSNVVNCDDARYVQHEDGIGWDIYIKMELLTPLAKALGKEIPEEQVIRIGSDLCKALILCKKHNIVHRDIKPANIFVSDNGDYKLGDFGIAKTVEKTSGGTKTGTYEYMAPEVYRDLPYGSNVDIYSLGMVLYWLLNEKRTPFLPLPPQMPTGAEKELARKRRFNGETIPAPLHGSPALKQAVLKAVAYDPKARYQTADELLRDLEGASHNAECGVRNEANSEFGVRNSELHKDAAVSAVGADALGGPRSPADLSPETVGATFGRPPVDDPSPRPSEAVGAIHESPAPAPNAKAEDAGDATVDAARAPVGPSIARSPVSSTNQVAPGAPAAARGPHPRQAAPADEEATVSAVPAAAPIAAAEDATVSARSSVFPARADENATISLRRPVSPTPAQPAVKQPAPAANPYPVPAQPKPAAPKPAEKPSAPPAKPGKKKLLPILIGAAVLVLAAVLLIVFLPRGGSASPSTVSSRPSSTSASPSASSSDASAPSAQDTPSVEEPAPAAPVDLRITLITDCADVNDGGYNQAAWEGLVAFAESKGLRQGEGYDYYRPSGDSGEDRITAVRTAVGNGANVIICPGWLFEDVVYRMQNEYPDVMFLLLDGSPHSDDYSGIETAANTHCVFYQEEQAGFLAGYAAVKDGCRDLGFVGGMAVPAVVRYGYGFVQGANCAAEELGVADQVSVKYWYCNSYAPSDEIQSKASRWYADGTEVIFSCGGTSYLSVVAAAENRGGKVICQDFDMSSHSPCILTSAAKDLGNSVVLSLEDLWNNNGVWSSRYAGSSAYLGAAENCIGLPAASASWRMSSFSVQEYEALYRKLQSGEILVSNDVTSEPSVSIAVDYYA